MLKVERYFVTSATKKTNPTFTRWTMFTKHDWQEGGMAGDHGYRHVPGYGQVLHGAVQGWCETGHQL